MKQQRVHKSEPEPKTRVVHYEETVFVCSNGAHDARTVYLWRGVWRCLSCTKTAMRLEGASSRQVACCLWSWSEEDDKRFRLESVRRAGRVRRVAPLRERQRSKRGVEIGEPVESR
jgi:hypothetical protein